ncbi:MAG: outer membrane protein assembly factor BamA [Elusimicrobia bacterium GWC2_65_9]|nr:MAG: outer membrane protein assembly factor BamA [Elusimicrobia bacterium GWA2_66_18]OGR76102.1 MAG: outer membrane protein assembly factor BamA [Elusimicrobia bacterium GWC2_65_9]
MSVLAVVVLSSSASAQTVSSGTVPIADAPTVSTFASLGAPSISTAPLATETTTSVELAPGFVPRPWVIGEIKAEGLKNVKLSTIRGQIKARKGALYDRPDLDQDIQILLGMGEFERVGAEISLLDKPVPEHFRKSAGADRQVLLTFTIGEKPLVRKIIFEGQKKVSKGTLSDLLAVKTSDPYDRSKLLEDRRKVLDKYREKGFLDAVVTTDVRLDTAASKTDLVFKIVEGPKSRIELIELAGTKTMNVKKLLKLMKNRRKKVYFEKDLPEDVKKIEAEYKNNGYLDVRLSTPLVTLSLDKTRISIALGVEEGRAYRFGETAFAGHLVFTSSSLAKTVEYRRGKIFNQEKFEDTIRGIQELYADVGRLRARINPVKTFNAKTDQMDVLYQILEGPISYVDHVDVEGNKATKTHVIRREIVVKPGDRFSAARVRKSREKIMNLGFMDEVDVDLQSSPTDPDKVDLTFDVAEGKPGMLTAGAAYSSIDGIIGNLSLQHLNLFGRAQKASLQWSFGKRVQDYSASWTTPWVGNHPTSLGFDVYNTRRVNPFDTSLAAYVEKRTGGAVRVGPRFQEDKYQLNLTYSISRITIQNVQNQFTGMLTEGTSIQSSFSAEFARDTRDSIWDPTRGTRLSLGSQLSGGPFMGDIHYFKPFTAAQSHWTLLTVEDWPFVLSSYQRAGYVTQFNVTKQVPVQDRYFIGGQDSLRGYSPSGEAGYHSGGKIYGVANLEFGFPLARERKKSIVKLVLFGDAGGSWDRVRDVSGRVGSGTRDIKTDVGIGLRFVTPAFPIRLDYGYGLNHRTGERLYQINFGLGPLF